MKKMLSLFLVLAMALNCLPATAEENSSDTTISTQAGEPPERPNGEAPQGTPPEMPNGEAPQGTPPEMPNGEAPQGNPPEMPNGEAPQGTPPDGAPNGQGGPGGGSSQPDSYDAATTISEDTTLQGGTYASTGTDENAILVTDGTLNAEGVTITRDSSDSTGGDSASFYGVGAAVLVTGGEAYITDSTITTDAKGGAGVFAYGDGMAHVSDTAITTTQDTSSGIHVAGGGTLYAENLTVTTSGESSAAIRSDRGSGTMVVTGGTYTSNGSGSPAVYVTADITISDAELVANGSEALCLEGLNSIRLVNSNLIGSMPDQDQNDSTWTVILYQSMSGDSQVGEGAFSMEGGTLTSLNGGVFYTTNTESEFTLKNVTIVTADDCEYLLRVSGNANQRGWGQTGSNGADCVFHAMEQEMTGNVIWDSISTLELNLTEGTVFTGAILDDETYAGNGGDGWCKVALDADSTWVVTGDSVVTTLTNAGAIVDADGNAVTIASADGEVYVEGTSAYTVTVEEYEG